MAKDCGAPISGDRPSIGGHNIDRNDGPPKFPTEKAYAECMSRQEWDTGRRVHRPDKTEPSKNNGLNLPEIEFQ